MRVRRANIGRIAVLLCLTMLFSAGLSACGKDKAPGQTAGADSGRTQTSGSPIEIDDTDNNSSGTVQDALQNDSKVEFSECASIMNVMCEASGIAAMPDGSLLVTDTYNKVVWKVQAHNGISTVYAGGETVRDLYGEPLGGYNDSTREESFFATPWAVAPFLDGWAVSDADNNAIRLISGSKVQTVNGKTTEKIKTGKLGVIFDHPTGLAADAEGNLYVSDTHNGAVRKISSKGVVTTFASGLKEPMGLCWKNGVLFIAETGANRILKYVDGMCETLAGCGEDGFVDGLPAEAAFSFPQGVAVGDDGAIYVADTGNSAVRMIKDDQVKTLLFRDRTSLEMDIVSPTGLLVQGEYLYICDRFTRKVFQADIP